MAPSDLQELAESPPPTFITREISEVSLSPGKKRPICPQGFSLKRPAESAPLPLFYLQPLLLPTLRTMFCKPKFLKLKDWLLS